ncbi:MAG: phosphatase PAP2 family protein [bacterium]|nr:phosphatase PAP2 family protein [bacterium]
MRSCEGPFQDSFTRYAGRAALLLVLWAAGNARAECVTRTLAHDARQTGRVTWRLLQAPFRGDAEDYALAGGILMGIAALSTLDRSVRHVADSSGGQWAETVSDVGHFYQRTGLTFAVAGAFYAAGLLAAEPSLRRTGQEVVESFCLSALGSQLVKRTLGRNRPVAENGPYHFAGPNWKDVDQSFPSGDTVVAFSLSTVLAAEAKSLPVAVALYSLAAATAFQRLHRDRHWLSDTVGGAVWGTAVGLGVVQAHRSLSDTHSDAALVPGANSITLTLNW